MASDPEGSRTYTLEMGEKRYRLKRSQLTTAVIGRLFGLQRSSVFLVSDDGDVETPNNEGEFKDISDFPVWRIEVGPSEAASHSSGSQVQSQRWSLGQPFYQPAGQSPEASASSSKWHPKNAVGKPKWQKNIEVFELRNGRPKHVYTHPLTLDDKTANVPAVAAKLSEEAFHCNSVALVDVKNRTVPDVEGTKGICTLKI